MIRLLLFFLLLASPSYAQIGPPTFVINVSDDDTTVYNPVSIGFSGAEVTENDAGVLVSIEGAGDSITVNSTSSTNVNFLDNLYLDFALDTSTTPDDITAKFNYAETLAGNPALLVDECALFKDTSGGGLICEGSTADTNEQLYRFPDVNGSDTTSYFMLDDTSITAIDDASLEVSSGTLRRAALSGDIVASAGSNTTTIQSDSVALSTDTTGTYAAGDAEAGAALTGDSATAFFSAGTIEHERGGAEADISAYDGLIGITGGATYNQTGTTTQIIIFDGAGAPTSAALSGDATMSNAGVVTVVDDLHSHTSTSVSGLDISADTNLAVSGTLLGLTDDTLSVLEGTLTDEKVCTYEATGTKIECDEAETGTGSIVRATAPTFATSITGSYLTASEILITDASKNIVSAAVATYPSLAELAYVKGVTSAIQTQFAGKASTALSNLASVAINTSLISDADSTDDLGSTSAAWANLYVDTIKSITGNPLALTPIAGQNLNISLSGAGDLAVNTNDLYLDTSTERIGIGTTAPVYQLDLDKDFALKGSVFGIDTNTKLLLHGDGTDGGTNPLDSSIYGHLLTAGGNAAIDTAQSVFGGSSLVFDGTGDYFSIPDNAAWQLGGGTGDFTLRMRCRFAAISAINGLLSQINDSETDGWQLYYYDTTKNLRFLSYTSSVQTAMNFSWTPSVDTWYDLMFVRTGNTFRAFIDGAQIGSDASSTVTIPNVALALIIGANHSTTPSEFLNGWLDEIKISNVAEESAAAYTSRIYPYSDMQVGRVGIGYDLSADLVNASLAVRNKVGIGTANPVAGTMLHVLNTSTTSGDVAITASRGSAGYGAISAAVSGDAFARLYIDSNGALAWGSGSGSQDTNLYRSAANTLTTDDSFTSAATGSLGWSIQSAANQACTTTCTSAAVFGWDTASGEVAVGPSDATADKCLCAGAS